MPKSSSQTTLKLRRILILLSILSIGSASLGGYFYYSALKNAAYQEARQQANARLNIITRNISFYLDENIRVARSLAGMTPVQTLFTDYSNPDGANEILDHYKNAFRVDVCYVMNRNGLTIASSNRMQPDSFVGHNFNFRPYFISAMQGIPTVYMALGTTSLKRGVYCSHPIRPHKGVPPVGVAVVKASIEFIEQTLDAQPDETIWVVSPSGIIFISNHLKWRHKALWPLSIDQQTELELSQQFGAGPWPWAGFAFDGDGIASDLGGKRYFYNRVDVSGHHGWQAIYMRDLKGVHQSVARPFIRISGPVILAMCLFIGLLVSFLYSKASLEIRQRRAAEEALEQEEARYRSIYHNTPAMLHSIDRSGRLIAVSNNWVEQMGYSREEVMGRPLTDFFTPESKAYAESEVFPRFFDIGYCKDVPYQFVKSNSERMDVLLSAIGDRDDKGRVTRSLAVSIDVTDRLRAEKALEKAKEALSEYSHNLERIVKQRTFQVRRLSGSIMANQEKERAAIARELHDELGQVLTALRIDAVWLAERLKASDLIASRRSSGMVDIIDKTIGDVRSIATRLRPGILDDLGLVDALEWHASDFEKRTGITCVFEAARLPPLPNTVATAAYRIAQEALTNTVRYAEASHVEMILGIDKASLRLIVTDDGRGFDPVGLGDHKGLGLAGMRERAGLLGGHFELNSSPGKGTTIEVWLPTDTAGGIVNHDQGSTC